MGRYNLRVSRLPDRRDTPVERVLGRPHRPRRLLPHKHHEAFPDEPEVEEKIVPTVKPTNPVRSYSSAMMEHSTQVTPVTEALKGGEMQAKEEEGERNLAMTSESTASSSKETDLTSSFDNDDDNEDCYSSASSSSSSLPSPEVFRKESYVEIPTFPDKEELLGLHFHIKNSTLLDLSHAETVNMYPSPNFSAIIGEHVSTILVGKNCEISNHRGPEAETKIKVKESFKSDNQAQTFKGKTPAKLCKKIILRKKKVCFRSPIITETFEANHIPAIKLTSHNTSESIPKSSMAEWTKPDVEISGVGETNSEDDTLQLRVTLKRPVKSSPEKARFFDFVSDSDRDLFLQKMRKRCIKLRSAPLFPLTAAEHT